MSTYTQDLKKAERAFQKKKKEERKQYLIKQEQADKLKHELYFLEVKEEKRQLEQAKKDKEVFVNEAKTFLQYLASNYQYSMYLIGWDICNNDYSSIETDIHKNKINLNMVQEVYNIACQMFTKFNFQIELIA